jgi:hypothetical protein
MSSKRKAGLHPIHVTGSFNDFIKREEERIKKEQGITSRVAAWRVCNELKEELERARATRLVTDFDSVIRAHGKMPEVIGQAKSGRATRSA